MRVRLYTKAECQLCEEAEDLLEKLREEFGFYLEKVDIYRNRRLFRRLRLLIPVVTVWGKTTVQAPITEASLREALSFVRQRRIRTVSRGR